MRGTRRLCEEDSSSITRVEPLEANFSTTLIVKKFHGVLLLNLGFLLKIDRFAET
jgi:hypothetical protein